MACTRISDVFKFGPIKENGDHFYDETRSFIYVEDLKKVLAQCKDDDLISQIKIVDITFPREDGGANHHIHDVKALAVAKRPVSENESEKLNEAEWHDIIGLFWPVYYHPGTVKDAVNPINGLDFSGHVDYRPGNIIGIKPDPNV